ncbi:MAG: hypothetical protein EBW90_06970 [Rhodobacteraceae bacterium]|nr:hypothetical protein [Paracoccaceae bacterium]
MKKLFPGILAMATIVVVSNILVQFFIGNWLTWGAFTYPFAFLVTDIINRMYGPSDARRVVFFGFIVGIICSLIGTQINIEIAPGTDHNIDFFNEIVMGPLGFEQTRWIATALVDWSVKVSIALIALIPFRMIIISYYARNN